MKTNLEEQDRKAFEEWMRGKCGCEDKHFERGDNDSYLFEWVEDDWEDWQAALAYERA